MSDYISRDAAIEALEKKEPLVLNDTKSEAEAHHQWTIDTFAVDRIPAADVAPVVHGTWLLRDSKCSVCGDIPEYEYDIRAFKYCPNCGSKMDIEDEQFWKEMHDEG